jgi:hypothetical protein
VLPDIEKKIVEKDDHAVFKELALHVISHNRKDQRILRLAIFSALEGFPLADIVHQGDEVGLTLPEILRSYIQKRIDDGAFQEQEAIYRLFYTRISCIIRVIRH